MLLADCLHLTPLRMLLAICQANNFACNARAPKADLVATLAQRLAGRARPAYLAQLPAPQREILAALAQQQGQMPLDRFQARFGQIRPYRPWRSDSPAHPWRNPASLPEELLFRGLIFVVKPTGQPALVVLPAEIASVLRPAPAAQALPPPTLPAASLLLDIALFLAYLQQTEVRPLHGRWLSPRHCRQIGARLAPPISSDLLHSERQARRLAFAHYLAEQLHLVTTVAGLLKPSPLAGDWLLCEPLELLRAWLDNSEDAASSTADGRLHADPGLGLALPPAAPPPLAAIFHLAPWCELEPGPRLVLTQASLVYQSMRRAWPNPCVVFCPTPAKRANPARTLMA